MFGVRILPLVVATLVFYFVGFLWYGVFFSEAWMNGSGYVESDFEGSSPAWMAVGFFISVVSVLVLGVVLNWLKVQSVGEAVSRTFVLWIGFGATFAAYALAYSPHHSVSLYLIDASHFLVGWLLAAVILARLK